MQNQREACFLRNNLKRISIDNNGKIPKKE